MKKLTNLVFVLALCASCSSVDPEFGQAGNGEKTMVANQNIEMLQLQSQVDSLNREMFPEMNGHTRGLFSFFKKVFSVIVSDAVGGLFGSLYAGPCGSAAGAVMMSATAAFVSADNIDIKVAGGHGINANSGNTNDDLYNKTFTKVNLPNVSLGNSVVPKPSKSSVIADHLDSIGYYHNKVLLELNNMVRDTNIKIDTLVQVVADVTSKNYNAPKNGIVESLNKHKDMFEYVVVANSVLPEDAASLHEVINGWKELYPEQSDKLGILETFFEGISNIDAEDNDGEYFNRVLDIISSSSLDNETKRNLRNAIIVGNASYQLWNTEDSSK